MVLIGVRAASLLRPLSWLLVEIVEARLVPCVLGKPDSQHRRDQMAREMTTDLATATPTERGRAPDPPSFHDEGSCVSGWLTGGRVHRPGRTTRGASVGGANRRRT